ncbi:MAG: SIR2 family protein [Bacteroidia bacterium]
MAINLPLIVSFSPFLNPDSLLAEANIPWYFSNHHYHMRREKDNLPMPSEDRSMIYDLFGSLKEEESMVLTYADLFDYIKAILGEKELPTNLQSIFQRSSYFIFLGFQFDKWYVQLILRLLMSIKGEHSPGTWTAPEEVQHQPIVDFLYNEFRIRIIQDVTNVNAFVDELYQHCSDEGLLRPDEATMDKAEKNLPSKQMVNFIRRDQLEEALDFAITFFEKINREDEIDDCHALNGRLNRLERKVIQGVISSEESDIKRNEIRVSLLSLNDKIKENE